MELPGAAPPLQAKRDVSTSAELHVLALLEYARAQDITATMSGQVTSQRAMPARWSSGTGEPGAALPSGCINVMQRHGAQALHLDAASLRAAALAGCSSLLC